MELTDRLHDLAARGGAAATGVCTADPFPEVAAEVRSRAEAGEAADLRFTYRDAATATDIRASFPWARSLFVAASAYLPEAGSPRRGPGLGRVARFATRDHYRALDAVLDVVANALRGAGYRATAVRDDKRLVDRAAAVRAGVGWWGKNTMVLGPAFGPWVLLGSVVTDASLALSAPMRRGCGSCEACLPACPTGALVAPGLLDARKCLAYWLQASGVIPRELRIAVADRVYGCDDCIEACPPGSRLIESSPTAGGNVDLAAMLAEDDASLLAEFEHFYIPGRRARYLRRNALVALGNTAGPEAIGILAAYAGHPDWLLRVHAAWALGRVGGATARAVLEEIRSSDPDSRVVEEADESLKALGAVPADGSAGSTLTLRMPTDVINRSTER